jgi:hypothetical protein
LNLRIASMPGELSGKVSRSPINPLVLTHCAVVGSD